METAIRTYSSDGDLVRLRREQIVRRAAQVLVKKGYEQTSVREIAKACNMSIGTLYHYVGSKEDILYLLIDHTLSQELDFIEKLSLSYETVSPTEALRQAIASYYRKVDDLQDMAIFGYQETKNLRSSARQRIFDLEERIVGAFERLLTRGCATREFKIDDVTMVAHNILVLGDMWAVRRWFLRKRYTLEQYIREQTEFVLEAICGRKGVARGTPRRS